MNRVYELRTQKKLSVRALAEKAGLSPDTVKRIEREIDPDKVKIETYNKLATALNCTTIELIPKEILVT